MTALRKEDPVYTIEDIYNLPDGERAELIDGQLYGMAPPNRRHQDVSGELYATIHSYFKSKGRKCKVYAAPFAVFLHKDDKTYVEPDLSVVCDLSKLNDKGCNGAPDWIIEIVSPSTGRQDFTKKLKLYMEAGVREYWIVDPYDEIVLVYTSDAPKIVRYHTFSEQIKVGIYEDFFIDFKEIDL